MDIKDFLKTKTATALLIVVLGLVVVFTGRLYFQKYEVKREIERLQAQADEIKKQNEDLSSLINYLNSDEYKEREAREKLNLRKEGEIVVALPKEIEERANAQPVAETKSNPHKWLDYFFTESNEN